MVIGEYRRFYLVKMGLEEAGGSLNANQRFQPHRPIFVGEFAVGLQLDTALHVSDRKDLAAPRADADDT